MENPSTENVESESEWTSQGEEEEEEEGQSTSDADKGASDADKDASDADKDASDFESQDHLYSSHLHTFRALSGGPHPAAKPQLYDRPLTAGALTAVAFGSPAGKAGQAGRCVYALALPAPQTSKGRSGLALVEPGFRVCKATAFWVLELGACSLESCLLTGDVVAAMWLRMYDRPWRINDPFQMCAKRGHIAFADWMLNCDQAYKLPANGAAVLLAAAEGNRVEFAEWALRSGFPPTAASVLLKRAAAHGSVEFAQWALVCKDLWDGMQPAETQRTGTEAQQPAETPHSAETLEAVDLERIARRWDGGAAIFAAAKAGQIQFADWALSKGRCPWPSSEDPLSGSSCVLSVAAVHKQVAFIKWAVKKGYTWKPESYVMVELAQKGLLRVAKQVDKLGCPWQDWLLAVQGQATYNGWPSQVANAQGHGRFRIWAEARERELRAKWKR